MVHLTKPAANYFENQGHETSVPFYIDFCKIVCRPIMLNRIQKYSNTKNVVIHYTTKMRCFFEKKKKKKNFHTFLEPFGEKMKALKKPSIGAVKGQDQWIFL